MAEPVNAQRIYAAMKRDLVRGHYRPSSLLFIPALCDRHDISASPVRDVLQRLVGERLVEAAPGGGFRVPALSLDQARDLYAWHGQIMRMALKNASAPFDRAPELDAMMRMDEPLDAEQVVSATERLFERLVERSRNGEHLEALRSAADRLHPLRLQETALANRLVELRTMWSAAVQAREAALREAVWAYHRRRLRRLPQLVRALRDEAGPSP